MQLYKLDKTDNSDKADQIAEIYTAVKSQISEKRFRHTLGVVQTAVLLADFYGENFYNAHVAAIFHDYAKEYSNHEMLNLCQQLQIPLDEIQQQVPNIMHGAVAAKLANRNFAITEKIILHAIENHTIPKPPLSLLDKIIKIADNTEPNRQNFSGQITLHELRKLSKIDLNKATISAIIGDMEYTKRKGQLLHPLSTEVLQYLQKEG
ncbi:MAG: bis(5'-nucleosyl)-tetraphosphatase (symmetrical) YqeK [Firmicutes bacterium]|nr:bis(5'-nucleosyl)-tetraphosphatase (symmetrical) YqeK [Bacillota bacterium]